MKIDIELLTPNKMSRPQTKLKGVEKIVIHYVANPKSTAINNRHYFDNLKNQSVTYASSHYIVGLQGEIIQCIPETEMAYHAGNYEMNKRSIGIENCHEDETGKFNDSTYSSLVELCADICTRYELDPLNDIIRHYDVTGKMCPLYYVKNQSAFIQLKTDVENKMAKVVVNDKIDNSSILSSLKKIKSEIDALIKSIDE